MKNKVRERAKRWYPSRLRGETTGSSLVEFALVVFLLMLIVAGVADFGRAFNNRIIITNASREGARYASRHPADGTEIVQAAINEASNSGVALTSGHITIMPDPSGSPAAPGSPVTVVVEYQFDTIFGGIVGFQQMTLRASTEMIVYPA